MDLAVYACDYCSSTDHVGKEDGTWLCWVCYQKLQETKKNIPGWLVCEDCHKAKPDTQDHYDPYFYEVYDEKRPCVLCDGCYQERSYDI